MRVWLLLSLLAVIGQIGLVRLDFVIAPIFVSMYRFQFYAVVMPYLIREYQRKNVRNSGIRILNENDPDILSSLEGKVAIITGGSRGLGVEVVRTFLRKGARVITTASSKDRKVVEERIAKITENIPNANGKLEIWHLDLMSMNSVIDFVARFKRQNNTQLNYLIGNAGVMFPKYKLSEDGFESQFSTNYLGHVLLSFHLLPYLHRSARQSGEQSRLVLVSSCLHHIPSRIRFNDLQSRQVYSPHYAYGLSKLSITMFIYKLSRTMKFKSDWGRQVKMHSLHPGLVQTDLLNTVDIMQQFPAIANQITFRSTKSGAETLIYAALSTQLNKKSGEYLEDSRISQSSRLSYNEDYQNRMWTITSNLLSKWTDGLWFEDL